MPVSHRIRKMRWEVRTGSTGEAFLLRKRLHDRWQELLPAFEAIFDAVGGGEEVIRIPRLTLRVCADSEATIFQAIAEAIFRQLRDQLRPASDRPPLLPKEERVKRVSAGEARLGRLRHYLLAGALPWEAAGLPAPEVAAAFKEVGRAEWAAVLEEVLDRNREEIYFRLIQIAPQKEAELLIDRISESLLPPWRELLAEICRALLRGGSPFPGRYLRLRLAAALLAAGVKERGSSRTPDLSSVAGRLISFGEEDRPSWLDPLLPEAAALLRRGGADGRRGEEARRGAGEERSEAGGEEGTRRGAPFFRRGAAGRGEERWPAVPSVEAEKLDDGLVLIPLPSGSGERGAGRPERTEGRNGASPSIQIDDGTLLRIDHAGLVLLHPYLSRFFESAGIHAPAGPLPPELLPRAACLLHFLATGREVVYEYELGLIKLLVGIDPGAPLPVSEGLIRDPDREEGEALLQSVIGYWKILKRTSIDGLRASFLQRNGLLRKEEGGWRLQVERMPFDLLIAHLPWGIGVVRLPWMKKPLYTEW